MKKAAVLVLLFWVVTLLAGKVGAETESFSSGTSVSQFLSIPAGARPAALGNAFTAGAGDLNALYWNPAGLSRIPERNIMLSHLSWIQQMNLEYLLYAQPIPQFGVLAAGLSYMDYGSIERWSMDASGNPMPGGGSYTPYALSGILGFGLPVGRGWSAGAGLRLSYEDIDHSGSLSGGLDTGVQYAATDDLCLAAAIRNIGVGSEERLLPLSLNLGASDNLPYSFSEKDLFTIFTDVQIRLDDQPVLGVGVEYTYIKLAQVRLGWNQDFGQTVPNRIGLTAGIGIMFQKWNLDYALAPQGDLGLSHRVSLQYGW
jgi:hypothetical protein